MTGISYDTGALIAAERNDRRMWALHRRTLERGNAPTVPAPVVVEAWRNGVAMARLLDGCHVDDLDAAAAKYAGLLLGRCREPVEATDAVVAEGALRRYDTVVTSNRRHLQALAAGSNRRLGIIDI
jgi:predicted nucleic acid-binding protein